MPLPSFCFSSQAPVTWSAWTWVSSVHCSLSPSSSIRAASRRTCSNTGSISTASPDDRAAQQVGVGRRGRIEELAEDEHCCLRTRCHPEGEARETFEATVKVPRCARDDNVFATTTRWPCRWRRPTRASSLSSGAAIRSLSCSRLVALDDRRGDRLPLHQPGERHLVRCWRCASWPASSSAFSTPRPLGLMYFFTPAPRGLLPTSASDRYLPLRNPLASE